MIVKHNYCAFIYREHMVEVKKVRSKTWELSIDGKTRGLTFPTVARASRFAKVCCDGYGSGGEEVRS